MNENFVLYSCLSRRLERSGVRVGVADDKTYISDLGLVFVLQGFCVGSLFRSARFEKREQYGYKTPQHLHTAIDQRCYPVDQRVCLIFTLCVCLIFALCNFFRTRRTRSCTDEVYLATVFFKASTIARTMERELSKSSVQEPADSKSSYNTVEEQADSKSSYNTVEEPADDLLAAIRNDNGTEFCFMNKTFVCFLYPPRTHRLATPSPVCLNSFRIL